MLAMLGLYFLSFFPTVAATRNRADLFQAIASRTFSSLGVALVVLAIISVALFVSSMVAKSRAEGSRPDSSRPLVQRLFLGLVVFGLVVIVLAALALGACISVLATTFANRSDFGFAFAAVGVAVIALTLAARRLNRSQLWKIVIGLACFGLVAAVLTTSRLVALAWAFNSNTDAVFYAKDRNYEKAIVTITEAIDRFRAYPQFYLTRGRIYTEMKESSKSAADFAKAKELGWPGEVEVNNQK